MGRKRITLMLIIASLCIFGFSNAEQPVRLIWIDVRQLTLTLYEEHTVLGRWPIAVGGSQTPTPLGTFTVTSRFIPEEANGFGSRFLGINAPWGQYGIHGTNLPHSIGSRTSHGCIRLFTEDMETLFRLVPNGTRVIIEDGPCGALGSALGTLWEGDRNAQVFIAQERLKQLGYYVGTPDGIYGAQTVQAVQRFRADRVLPGEGIDTQVWAQLGVMLFE